MDDGDGASGGLSRTLPGGRVGRWFALVAVVLGAGLIGALAARIVPAPRDSAPTAGMAQASGTVGHDRLYVLSHLPRAAGAYDAVGGRVAILDRVDYILGHGPATLALAPDGRRLYVYSYAWGQPEGARRRIEIVDTATGQLLPDAILLPGCGTAALAVPRAAGVLFVTCFASGDIRIVNVATRQVERQLRVPGAPAIPGPPGGIAGTALSPDDRTLYVVTDTLQLFAIDTGRRTIGPGRDLGRTPYRAVSPGFVALSADGRRLCIGVPPDQGAAGAGEVRVFDTGTWQETRRVPSPRPLAGAGLALSPDGGRVYGIGLTDNGRPLPAADTIVALSIADGQADEQAPRQGEEILRLFVGP